MKQRRVEKDLFLAAEERPADHLDDRRGPQSLAAPAYRGADTIADQVAGELTFAVEPSLYFAVATNCSVAPAAMVAVPGATETAVIVFT